MVYEIGLVDENVLKPTIVIFFVWVVVSVNFKNKIDDAIS